MNKNGSPSHSSCEGTNKDRPQTNTDTGNFSPSWLTSTTDEGGARYSYRNDNGSYPGYNQDDCWAHDSGSDHD